MNFKIEWLLIIIILTTAILFGCGKETQSSQASEACPHDVRMPPSMV